MNSTHEIRLLCNIPIILFCIETHTKQVNLLVSLLFSFFKAIKTLPSQIALLVVKT